MRQQEVHVIPHAACPSPRSCGGLRLRWWRWASELAWQGRHGRLRQACAAEYAYAPQQRRSCA